MNNASLLNLLSLVPFFAFLLLLILQFIKPRRDPCLSGINRIFHNLFLFLVNTVILRMLVPLTLVVAAKWATMQQIGLFNVIVIDDWIVCLLAVVILDFAVYWQHVLSHKWSWLWRLHKVHHADQDMDVTTAFRFHPIELVISLLYKSAIVILLGAPVVAVILFEMFMFIGPAFNHSNIRIPAWLDSRLRWVIATPDVHRSHHSVVASERNTNYGFFLIWWDKLFSTYTQRPAAGHVNMKIGLADENEVCERVDQMLLAPFR